MRYYFFKFFLLFSICSIAVVLFQGVYPLQAREEQPIQWSLSDKILGGGSWTAECTMNEQRFRAGDYVSLDVQLNIESKEFLKYKKYLKGLKLVLKTERIFDAQGRPHLINNNFMSTVLTPTGMPIEFFSWPQQGENNKILGRYESVFHLSDSKPLEQIEFLEDSVKVKFTLRGKLPQYLPAGYYRFHLDTRAVFLKDSKTYEDRLSTISQLRLDPDNYFHPPFHEQLPLSQKNYTLPVFVVGKPKLPKMVWMLFMEKIEMGTQGIVSDEDKNNFRLMPRHSVSDRFIIQHGEVLNIEPDFPAFFADKASISFVEKILPFCVPIPLDYKSGEFSVKVTFPDGTKKKLGKRPFRKQSVTGGSSGADNFKMKFDHYGHYKIEMQGWINDIWGHRYTGGGTYHLWVANRLSFATSVKPGSPFEVGNAYPSSVFVHPPCRADVRIDIREYVNSEIDNVKEWNLKGKANRFGYFYSKEKVVFEEPGEYIARVSAEYKDPDGTLWIGNQVGSCVIAPQDTKLIVHGRKFKRPMNPLVKPKARFNLLTEGRISDGKEIEPETMDYTNCTNLPLPYYSGDVMYIASTLDGANAIDALLSAELPSQEEVITRSENNVYSYDFPEKFTTQAYFYVSAIRPGIMTRTFVADSSAIFRDGYWTTSPAYNAFGNQFGASKYGDSPEDMYRFMGGFVYRNLKENKTHYGIYSSMAMVIPKGSNANRIVAPLTESLLKVKGREFFIFEAGAPSQGVIYEIGDPLGIGGFVFPSTEGINCTKTIVYPDGREFVSSGISNKIGLLKMSPNMTIADIPGVYKIKEKCWFGDKSGDVLGTGDGAYNIYVDDNSPQKYFHFQMPGYFRVNPDKGLHLIGKLVEDIEDARLTYSIIMPGAVMDEGTLPVSDREFDYLFIPEEFNAQFPNYDLYDIKYSGDSKSYVSLPDVKEFIPNKKRLVDIVMMTFFLEGKNARTKEDVYDVTTVMLRGEQGFIKEYN